ncbi:MAG: hypothetical protein Q4D60_02490 [Eubacteriales bacterium]|nr:hypothetical protein [Eubacteriales bacterium]
MRKKRSVREEKKREERLLWYGISCFGAVFVAWTMRRIFPGQDSFFTVLQCFFFFAALFLMFLYGWKNQDFFLVEDWDVGEDVLEELTKIMKNARERLP